MHHNTFGVASTGLIRDKSHCCAIYEQWPAKGTHYAK